MHTNAGLVQTFCSSCCCTWNMLPTFPPFSVLTYLTISSINNSPLTSVLWCPYSNKIYFKKVQILVFSVCNSVHPSDFITSEFHLDPFPELVILNFFNCLNVNLRNYQIIIWIILLFRENASDFILNLFNCLLHYLF